MKLRALKQYATGLAVAALGSVAASGIAYASPLLEIVTQGEQALQPVESGDPNGTAYPGGTIVGAGLPSVLGGWPQPATGFAPDTSVPGNPLGTSGFAAGYLFLTQAADVTFQYMGGGNSSLANQFWVNGVQLFQDHTTLGCTMLGPTNPSCTGAPGQFTQNQYTIALPAGLIPFQFITGNGVVLDNTGAGLGNPAIGSSNPGYMLGVDPYLATGQFDLTSQVMYAGLSDLPILLAGEHDFQDLAVRISVPEPGTLLLLAGGLMGLGASRRRKA